MQVIIKFYADTPRGEKNKLFRWRSFGPNGVRNCLLNHIAKGFIIKAAWSFDYSKGILSNMHRIDLSNYGQQQKKIQNPKH